MGPRVDAVLRCLQHDAGVGPDVLLLVVTGQVTHEERQRAEAERPRELVAPVPVERRDPRHEQVQTEHDTEGHQRPGDGPAEPTVLAAEAHLSDRRGGERERLPRAGLDLVDAAVEPRLGVGDELRQVVLVRRAPHEGGLVGLLDHVEVGLGRLAGALVLLRLLPLGVGHRLLRRAGAGGVGGDVVVAGTVGLVVLLGGGHHGRRGLAGRGVAGAALPQERLGPLGQLAERRRVVGEDPLGGLLSEALDGVDDLVAEGPLEDPAVGGRGGAGVRRHDGTFPVASADSRVEPCKVTTANPDIAVIITRGSCLLT